MARRAWIRNLVLVRHRRSDELEGMGTDERAWHAFGLDLRHVTSHALASGTAILVMRVLLQRRRVRAVWRRWSMAIETDLVRGLP